ncbi:MAG: peptidyl-prolyl cis-trans isomerase [Desulfomonile tiedjei]|nr:peptidyl-prolyl cis-trans isomerase [Desulfomonile tiedjei]
MQTNLRIYKDLLCGAFFLICFLAVLPQSFAAGEDKVLARIGNETVSEKDLSEMSNAVPERFREFYRTPEGRQKTLDYIVNIYVLAAEAEKQGLDKAPDTARLLQFTKKDLLARLYLEKMTKDMPVPTDADAKAFYENNKAQYTTPESVHLHHVLVKTDKEAKDVLAKLKKGEKFADIASTVSICPSRVKGGNLEWLPKGSLVKEIEDVAFTAKKGEIFGPVKTKFGYHVLLVEDTKPAQESSFDQVKDYIMEQLKFQKQQEQYEKLAEQLRKKMNVQVTQEAPPVPAGPAGPTPGPKN